MLNKSNELCGILNETYNANFLKEYPNINNIFYDVRDMYEKSPEKFPNANKTFMSLINNLENPDASIKKSRLMLVTAQSGSWVNGFKT